MYDWEFWMTVSCMKCDRMIMQTYVPGNSCTEVTVDQILVAILPVILVVSLISWAAVLRQEIKVVYLELVAKLALCIICCWRQITNEWSNAD